MASNWISLRANRPLGRRATARNQLSPDEFRKRRAQLPEAPGRVSPVEEERDAFVVRVLLSETTRAIRVADYVVPKTTWDAWWKSAKPALQGKRIAVVASDVGPLPDPMRRREATLGTPDRSASAGSGRQTQDGLPCADDDTWDNGILDDLPDARKHHTAVWTGSLMVVWGGSDGIRYLNTGGRYDPATDHWTLTSMVGAPAARDLHTAVWTGSLMVVWGGYNGGYFDAGGRYDPAADSWTPTQDLVELISDFAGYARGRVNARSFLHETAAGTTRARLFTN